MSKSSILYVTSKSREIYFAVRQRFYLRKMKLLACFLVSMLLIKAEGCLSRKKRPDNSLVSCVFDRKSDRYTHCRYVCREGFHFTELVEEKVQLCVNGTWIPEKIGDCIAQTDKETVVGNSCSSRPKHPKNSHASCIFDTNLTEYKSCAYFCTKGSYFEGKVVHMLQSCVNGTWVPKEVRNCVSQTEVEHSCSSRPKRPRNSLSTCRFDENLEGYTSCTYACKATYYFHAEINEKTQFCVNGNWAPEELGDCVNETERYSPAALSCFVRPEVPKKSFAWCNFDDNLGAYTECAYTCNTGYHFDGMVSEKKRFCIHGQWIPEQLEDCSDQIKRFAVGIGPCSSKPYLPKNSFVSCTIERGVIIRRNCTYVCRKGYFFPDMKNTKMQHCVDDAWTPSDFGHCISPIDNPDSVERACSSVPAKRPRNSLTYFSYNGSLRGFTDSKYVCFVGYNFEGTVNERTQFCANGTWIPENVGNCV